LVFPSFSDFVVFFKNWSGGKMPIRVKPRAFVSQEVLDFYQHLAKFKLGVLLQQLKQVNPQQQKWILGRNKVMLAKLSPIAMGITEAGKGLDHELARLRALDYDRIELEDEFLVARTKDLMIEQLNNVAVGTHRHPRISAEVTAYWDAGPYWIYIPKNDLIRGSMRNIHFIPQRSLSVVARHPHHYGYEDDDRYGRGGFIREGVDVRRVNADTCWGEFSEPISGALQDGDLVEILRTLRIFVGRYYSNDALRRPELYPYMDFMKKVYL
jgi:hypothetical protein